MIPLYSLSKAATAGSRQRYVEVGEGDPIVMLHGTLTSSYLWRNVRTCPASDGWCANTRRAGTTLCSAVHDRSLSLALAPDTGNASLLLKWFVSEPSARQRDELVPIIGRQVETANAPVAATPAREWIEFHYD